MTLIKMDRKNIEILGVSLNNFNVRETIREILLLKSKKNKLLFTPNVDFLINAQIDEEFKHILNCADISIPDGKPLIWASRFLGEPLKEKISGSSLFFKLCEITSDSKLSFFLLGGAPGISAIAKKKLQIKYPDINIVGNYSPPFNFENDEQERKKIIKMINILNPDILVLGFGSPKQEQWIYKNKTKIKFGIAMGLGATIDFASEQKKMPPKIIKNIGFGWLWRLVSEPKRLWKRYLIKDMKFFWYIFQQKFGLRKF